MLAVERNFYLVVRFKTSQNILITKKLTNKIKPAARLKERKPEQ